METSLEAKWQSVMPMSCVLSLGFQVDRQERVRRGDAKGLGFCKGLHMCLVCGCMDPVLQAQQLYGLSEADILSNAKDNNNV